MSDHAQMSGDNDALSVHAPSDEDNTHERGEHVRDTDVAQILHDNRIVMKRMLESLEVFNDRERKRKRSPSSSSSSSDSSHDSSRQSSRSPSPHPRPPTRKEKGLKQQVKVTGNNRGRSPSSDWTTATLEARLLSRYDTHGQGPARLSPSQDVGARSNKNETGETTRNSLFSQAGQDFEEDNDTSGPVSDDLAEFIRKVFTNKGKDEKLREKVKQYKWPENCPDLATPLTNPEIWGVLKAPAKQIDSKLSAIQKHVGKSAVAVAQCADVLAKSDPTLTKQLIDALALLGHAHQCITLQRKDRQKYALPWDIRGICDPSQEMSQSSSKYLYGNDLKKALKDAKESKSLTSSLRTDYSYKRRSSQSKPGKSFLDQHRYSSFPKWKSQGPTHKRGHQSQYRRRKQMPPQ